MKFIIAFGLKPAMQMHIRRNWETSGFGGYNHRNLRVCDQSRADLEVHEGVAKFKRAFFKQVSEAIRRYQEVHNVGYEQELSSIIYQALDLDKEVL